MPVKKLVLQTLLFLLPFGSIRANDNTPNDQLLVVFGSSGYVLYKVLDFANDHGFRYIKILSYEFAGFGHTIVGKCEGETKGGTFFELKDENASVSFLCFEEKPDDIYIIDLHKYHSILEDVINDSDR
ncbi:MAG: hypothetical protein COT85_04560 [Chlamydiae bacterium CG10_big_fil_rev_8_21_14_0_10_42_34]|nr:MAG: hypothetical protein COT85_04560 [Chlamydiae bacterium CG10_big_fil_rev_8_21_14_0_10_42_34]